MPDITLSMITNKYRAGDIRHCFSDISKIKNENITNFGDPFR